MTLRLLVMDDETKIAEMIRFWMTHKGYEVTVTYEGEEAIRAFLDAQEQDRSFDVVLLDLIVPNGLGGQATQERLRTLDPDVRVIVCSGYAHDPIMALHEVYGFDGIVSKPFTFVDLENEVARVADLPVGRRNDVSF